MKPKIIKFILFVFILFGSLETFSQAIKSLKPSISEKVGFSNPMLTYKIIESVNGTWGYDILNEEKVMIHQTSIPGKSGIEGFKTKEQATLVAKAIIEKINKGIKPPSISIVEMKLLGAL